MSKKFLISDVLSYSFKTTLNNLGLSLLLVLSEIIVPQLILWLFGVNFAIFETGRGLLLPLIVGLVCYWLTLSTIQLGVIKIVITLHDTGSASIKDLFSLWSRCLVNGLASVLYYLICLGGFIFFIIPGVIFTITYSFYRFVIVDKNLGAWQSLKRSAQLTVGSKMNLFLLYLVFIGLNVIGACFLLIGLGITIPMTLYAQAYVYRKLDEGR